MTTLQEYLNEKYPTEEDKEKVKKINISAILARLMQKQDFKPQNPEESLDLSEYKNLESLSLNECKITKIEIGDLPNLTNLTLTHNYLTSVEFLNQLSNPKKLETLVIGSNNIQPTDIEVFSRFVNLKELKIGTTSIGLEKGKRNKFYGFFKSWKNLTKLTKICIEATDVNEGLEYLPSSLKKIYEVDCQSHNTNAKCSAIQNELRPFNYDLEA